MNIDEFLDPGLCEEVDRLPLIGAAAAAQQRIDAREAARREEPLTNPCKCVYDPPSPEEKADYETVQLQQRRDDGWNQHGAATLTVEEMRRGR